MQAKQTLHAKKWSSAHALRLKTVETQSYNQGQNQGGLREVQNQGYEGQSRYEGQSWAASRPELSHNKTQQNNNISNNTGKLQVVVQQMKPSKTKIFSKSQSMGRLAISSHAKSEGHVPPIAASGYHAKSEASSDSSDEFALHARKSKEKKKKKVKEGDSEVSVLNKGKLLHALKAMNGKIIETDAAPSPELKGQCFCGNASAYRYVMFAEPFDHVSPVAASSLTTETTRVSDSSDLLKHSLSEEREDREESAGDDVFDNRLEEPPQLTYKRTNSEQLTEEPPQLTYKRTNSEQLCGPNGEEIKIKLSKKKMKCSSHTGLKTQCPLDINDDDELQCYIDRLMKQSIDS